MQPQSVCTAILMSMSLDLHAIRAELIVLAAGNEEYAAFNRRIVNTDKSVLGVRIPDLRKLAKRLAADCGAQDAADYMNALDKTSYEQVMLAGLIINHLKSSDRELIELTKQYLQLVDSWAEVDIYAMKRGKFDKNLWWNFAVSCLDSPREFTVRYGIMEMMANYLNSGSIEAVFTCTRTVRHDGYYVRMGLAWLYATAAAKFYERTLREIKTAGLGPRTKAKALTKMLESRQFTAVQKEQIRSLRSTLLTQK